MYVYIHYITHIDHTVKRVNVQSDIYIYKIKIYAHKTAIIP